MTGVGALAAWTSPLLVVAVVARVAAGGVDAPLFVFAVLAAPLLALLAGSGPRGPRSSFVFTIGLATVACVLGAGLRAVTDLGGALGLETGATLGSMVALVLATTVWPGHQRVAAAALVLGAGALLTALVILGSAAAAAPWTVWSRVASRSAFELGARSPWTRDGAQFVQPIMLGFTEPHRITAATAGVFRVTERDRAAVVVREWRLDAGDSLMLRPGDSLSIPADVRVRFEKGKRVPGAPVSGVTWADRSSASRPRAVVSWLGLIVTLAGGALLIVRLTAPVSRSAALYGPVTLLGVVLAATCWGVYAVDAAPELSIGAPAAALLARLGPVVADEPWRSRLLAAVVVALVALLLASAAALRQRLVDLAAGESGRLAAGESGRLAGATRRGALGAALWVMVVAAAATGSVAITDGWSLLIHGAGLAAAVALGPLLATGEAPGLARARAMGQVTGAAVFVVLTIATHWLAVPAGAAAAVAEYPALVAVPGAWLVATLARASAAASGEMVAATRRR
jgi:hypothetical protein